MKSENCIAALVASNVYTFGKDETGARFKKHNCALAIEERQLLHILCRYLRCNWLAAFSFFILVLESQV